MNMRCTWSIAFLMAAATNLPGADERAPIDTRYGDDAVKVQPDFRQHVVPLMGKLGCNGRACHGSFQGQGGFRLSLFGYDFKADHENLLAGDEPRINKAEPVQSLILTKPLQEIPHEGGTRLEKGTWQYRVMRKWLEDGAAGVTDKTAEFVKLEVTPGELVAKKKGDTWQLKAIAVWSDGTREDVTPLCRFQSNNDQVATIEQSGKVTATGPGDSHVVAFYDNGVVPIPVIHPVSDKIGPNYPSVPTPTKIDELVVEKLKKLGEVPSELNSDADFLRRVSLDMTGTLPTAVETTAFLADASPDKRAKKIDELLERPGYAAWWATKFSDWTGNNERYNQNQGPDRQRVAAEAWYEWVRVRFEKNMPYDEMVEGIVLARSRLDDESYEDYCKRMSSYQHKGSETSFADQPFLPYYWSRSNFRSTEERALGFAYTFLGVRIQCAQCHKHPFDQWTKDDFDRFKGFFARVSHGSAPGTRDDEQKMIAELGVDAKGKNANQQAQELVKLVNQGKIVPFRETFVPGPQNSNRRADAKKDKNNKRPRLVAGRTATVLGGDEIKIDEMEDPRQALMDWMRDDANPYFARAIVNRVWAGYFNVGIVEPPDDLSLANPPSNEALLDYLADQFRAHGYNMKWLHREIANSRTYQLSWQTNETNRLDERNFARAVPRRIPAEVVYDAIRVATASNEEAAKLQASVEGRAVADPIVSTRGGRGNSNYALTVFGRSIRESNCDCDRSMEPSLLQTVYLKNDQELLTMISRKGGWVDQMVRVSSAAADSDEEAATARRNAERVVDRMENRLKKAKANGKDELVKQAEQELAAAKKRAAELRKIAEKADEEKVAVRDEAQIASIVNQAYLRTLNRPPVDDEAKRAAAYFHENGDLAVATRDLLWALLNTKEFVVNH